jgi:hypothetical protein
VKKKQEVESLKTDTKTGGLLRATAAQVLPSPCSRDLITNFSHIRMQAMCAVLTIRNIFKYEDYSPLGYSAV